MSNAYKSTELGVIPIDWDIVRFDSIAELRHGHQYRNYDFTDEGIKILKITQIKSDETIDLSSCSFISGNRLEEFQKVVINKGDILIALTGATIGKIARFKSEELVLQNYRVGNFFPLKEDVLYKDYFFHFLRSNLFYHQIISRQTQSAQQNIGKEEINNMLIFFPSFKEQKAIASILTSFDDKIELLQAQNETLETIAQTIFKEWFGKYQVGDELPEGWRVGKLKEFIVESIGGDYGKEVAIGDFTEETVCLRGTDLPDMKMGVPQKAPIRFLKKSKLENCKLVNGDIVIEISGGTENQSTGRVAYINEEILNNSKFPMTCVNFCRILRPKNVENSYFIYSLFEYLYNRKVLFNWENGTTGIKNLNLKALLNVFNLVLPISDHKISEFNKYAKSSFIKIQSNNSQIQTRQATRDTLLPKLMSGKVRVDEFKE